MEDNLIQWQATWQQQKSKPMQVNNIISRLNSLEQKAKAQRIMILLLFAVLIIAAVLRPLEILEQPYNLLAYVFMLLAMGVKLIPSLKGRYHLITNEAELDNRNFVKKLKGKLIFDTRYLVVFLILTILGLNCALLGLYEKGMLFNFDFNAENRVVIHLSTVLIFMVGYVVNRRRVRESQHEISELIRELEG